MKQPKVYIKHLDIVSAVETIDFHEKTVEVFFYDNLDNVPFNFDEVEFIYGTGFIDKNGKEIKSGDIVKTDFGDVFSIKFNTIYFFYNLSYFISLQLFSTTFCISITSFGNPSTVIS